MERKELSKSTTTPTKVERSAEEEKRRRVILEELVKFIRKEKLGEKSSDHVPPQMQMPKEKPGHNQEHKKQIEFTEIFKSGNVIGDRFQILHKIAEGGFAHVYKVFDRNTKLIVALKTEKFSSVSVEIEVLQKLQNVSHFPLLYGYGKTSSYIFVAMQLLGKNLTDLRKCCRMKKRRLSASASVRVAHQCLQSVESLHKIGYLHRDIKPSNFAIGLEGSVVYMLDFGLARYYLKSDGSHKPPRESASFRGTVRYASLNAHQSMDLSRRDDLWSLFYSFYELLIGKLEWRKSNDKKIVAEIKQLHSPESMCRGLPNEIGDFVKLIRKLAYEDNPYYDFMYACLVRFMTEINSKFTDLYDWQVQDCSVLYHWVKVKSKNK